MHTHYTLALHLSIAEKKILIERHSRVNSLGYCQRETITSNGYFRRNEISLQFQGT